VIMRDHTRISQMNCSYVRSMRWRGRVVGLFLFVFFLSLVFFSHSFLTSSVSSTATASSSDSCWRYARPMHSIECGGRDRDGDGSRGICRSSRPLLNSSLSMNCACGRGLDAGYCVSSGSKVRCLPSFVIAGAMKSGTGALLRWLEKHPHLQSGKGADNTNEIHFFGRNYEAAECKWSAYAQHFPRMSYKRASQVYTFDKSPDYMRDPEKIKQMALLVPSAKIIVTLRNPSSRAYSGFQHNCRHTRFVKVKRAYNHTFTGRPVPVGSVLRVDSEYNNDGSKEQDYTNIPMQHAQPLEKGKCTAIDFHRYAFGVNTGENSVAATESSSIADITPNGYQDIAIGHYEEQLRNIYASFPSNQVLVLFQEHMIRDTQSVLRRTEEFLGLPPFDYQENSMFTTKNGDQGFSYVWKEFWRSSKSSSSGNSGSGAVPFYGPLLPTTRTMLDEYYRHRNTKLKALLTEHGALTEAFPFPSSWPVSDA